MGKPKVTAVVALLEELLRDEQTEPEAVYYDQTNSPLPRETHCRLVRQGKLAGYKVAGRVLVKRADMHAFIEAHRVEPVIGDGVQAMDKDAIVAASLKRLGMRRAG